MTSLSLSPDERRNWTLAGAAAFCAHVGVAALVLAWSRAPEPPVPEPVVLIELPEAAAPAPAASAQQPVAQPQPDYVPPRIVTPPIDVPPVRAPLPKDPVTLPPQTPPQPARQPASASAPAAVNPVVTSPTGAGTGTSPVPGNDPRAKKAEVDYFSLISAYLNRRKTFPVEAKRARQEGIVTVRFTVDRNGNVSNVLIRRGSGHELLDNATLQLLQRVAPLPRMPASMQRDSVTFSLPIDYTLRTN